MWIKNFVKKILFRRNKKDEVELARSIGVKVGKNCNIYDDAKVVFHTEPYLVRLGNNVTIAPEVRFLTHEGSIGVLRVLEEYKTADCFAPIIVGDNVFIGLRSIIMPGVHIGNNVVVGAQSIVTKNIPDNTVVVGAPARVLCSIEDFKNKIIQSDKYIVPTKGMTPEQKKRYLSDHFPEWFS
ncbi:MAG: acyltransferase [Alphaproteobacteria bacterium]|nr:acyltransferase [Alphaproteobacteria bacterium]